MISCMTEIQSIASYLSRIGAEPRSLRVAVVKFQTGAYWTDTAIIRLDTKTGSVEAPEGYEPTEQETFAIRQDILANEWPTSVKLGKSYELPPELKACSQDDIYELRDRSGSLIMIQQRTTEPKSGEKRYRPWTMWSDGQWRKAEPEGPLPLYGLETIGDHTTVFIHEGAKAARAVSRLIDPRTMEEKEALEAHPWGRELGGAVHLGWIGGALSPSRTDWSELAKAGVKRAYIVADNDKPGKAAIPQIAQRLKGITCFAIEFTNVWPASFDLADPFPKKMFSKIGSTTFYNGPGFRDVLHPATWATDMMPAQGSNDKKEKEKSQGRPKSPGKPVAVLRPEFADLWIWVEKSDTFVCREMPEINYSEKQFNPMVSAFSHVLTTGRLIQKTYKGRIAKLCYRPDVPERIITDRTTSAINLHTPSTIKPMNGDVGPWEEFLEYLFPVDRERREVKRWCATLIARPEVRMLYGMLLVTERQGMGKEQPLTAKILTPKGWKTMADMKIGMEISDVNGGTQVVTDVFPQGIKPVYRVTFSDGEVVETGADHNWLVRKGIRHEWQIRTTKEIFNNRKLRPQIPIMGACHFDTAQESLEIPPYVLGAFIGDGYLKRSSALSIPPEKQPILDRVRDLLSNEFTVKASASGVGKSCPQCIASLKPGVKALTMPARLEALGLRIKSPTRFIPEPYLKSSIENRIELLRGLMDTDGTAKKGRTSFSTSSPQLAKDFMELTRSLGGMASVKKYKYRMEAEPEYRIRIRTKFAPFHLPYKLAGWKPAKKEYGNRIVSIEQIGQAEQQCILVSSPEKLYVTDGYKVTHNSTLGERILAPLVGINNTGFPSENDMINSPFNEWIANKRLVVVGEIYTGHSFKAYNILKSYITDKNINVNGKFQRPYTVENWSHIVACSNSKKALRVEETDRRWFYPKLNEVPWTEEKWGEFYEWIASGGLNIISQWAADHGDYVMHGEHAPMTASKKSLIRDSKGEVINHWLDIMESVEMENEVVAFALNNVRDALKKQFGKIYETVLDFKREAIKRGWQVLPIRVRFQGSLSWVVLSPALTNGKMVEEMDPRDPEVKALIQGSMKMLEDRVSEMH